jgi:hypothetical protein
MARSPSDAVLVAGGTVEYSVQFRNHVFFATT